MTSPDILEMDFDSYLETIRRFTDEELIPGEAAMVETGDVPPALMARIAENGLFGITLPREWGGLDWSMEQQVRLTLEFTRASPVYRSRFSTTIGLCSQILHDHGTDAQKERYLRDMATGRCVTSFALTEPGAGSVSRSPGSASSRPCWAEAVQSWRQPEHWSWTVRGKGTPAASRGRGSPPRSSLPPRPARR